MESNKALATASETLPAVSESVSFIEMLERVATNPAVDVAKMSALLDIKERVINKQAEAAFNEAMNAVQAEVGRVAVDSENNQTHSKYASYEALDGKLRPIYTKHGFSISFDNGDAPAPEMVRVLCYVAHKGGFTKTYRKDVPADGKGAKGGDVMTKTHASGAADTYGRRYLLRGIFNIATGEGDDDGNSGPKMARVSPEQAKKLRDLIAGLGVDDAERAEAMAQFLNWREVNSVEDVAAQAFNDCVRGLEAKKKALKK